MRQLIIVLAVAVLLALAASRANGQVILPNPPWCDPCPPTVYLPIIHISQEVR